MVDDSGPPSLSHTKKREKGVYFAIFSLNNIVSNLNIVDTADVTYAQAQDARERLQRHNGCQVKQRYHVSKIITILLQYIMWINWL